jgi:hypothetical protein
MKEKNRAPEIFESSVPFPNGFEFLDFSVQAFGHCVGEVRYQGI